MTKDEALRLALVDITRIPTLSHGVLVKLSDVETAIKAALVNEALERKAENARKLGLDYEPLEAKDEPITKLFETLDVHDTTPPQLAEQWAATSATDAVPSNLDAIPASQKLQAEIKAMVLAAAIEAALEAKDEPVAWMYDWTTSEGEFIQNWTTSEAESLRDTEPNIITNIRPLYTATPSTYPCPTCESLARAVMMDQTGRDL